MRRPDRLLDTALACVEQGIPVRPAAPPRRLSRPRSWRVDPRRPLLRPLVCSCGRERCDRAGAHPIGDGWLTTSREVTAAWTTIAHAGQTSQSPNLLICSSNDLALWRLPRVDGAYGMRLFEQQRPGPWPPLLKLPDGDWIVATQPTSDEAAVRDQLPAGVTYLPPGTPVLAPPSHRPGGRVRWLQSPGFPTTPLPAAEDVLSLVGLAEQQRHELHGTTR